MSQSPPARGCSSEAGCGEGWELGGGAAAWTVRNRKSPSGSIKSPGCLSQQQKLSVGPIIHATGPSLQSALRSCVRYGHRTRTCVRVCVCVGGLGHSQLPGPGLPFCLSGASWDRMESFGSLGGKSPRRRKSGRSAGWSRAGRGGRGEARPEPGIKAAAGAAGAGAERRAQKLQPGLASPAAPASLGRGSTPARARALPGRRLVR